MPRVVFWGPDTSMTGNTHAAVAISTVMSVVHKASCLLMQGNFDSKKIETSYTLYDQLKASGALDNANLGVSALIRLVTSNKLTSDAIQNYAKPVLKGRLDILYGMTAKDKDGYNDLVNNLPYITRKAAEIYDLVFLDLPKGMSQKFVRDTLADAEIVVCICNQDVIKLDEFFNKVSAVEELKDKQKIYVIADYESKSRFNIQNIKIKYRIKEPIYAVPHNYLFADACNTGTVIDFVYKNINADSRDYNGYFLSQTNEVVSRIFELSKLKEESN
mgnify:FL=1